MRFKIFLLVCFAAEIYSAKIDKKHQLLGNKPVIKIIGGENAQPDQSPYVVSIQLRSHHGDKQTDKHICEGAIISERWILTAAHCYNNGNILFVKAGKLDLTKKENHEQVIQIKKFIKPKSFSLAGPRNDIALALLQTPLRLNNHVAKVALPANNSEPTGQGTLSGWGATSPKVAKATSILQTLTLTIIDRNTCRHLVGKINPGVKIAGSQICTLGSSHGGIGGCKGDSGSPLVVTHNGHHEVVGIFSWTFEPCASKGSPDVFSKVSTYLGWIEKVMHIYKV